MLNNTPLGLKGPITSQVPPHLSIIAYLRVSAMFFGRVFIT